MQIRRCAVLYLEPREHLKLDLVTMFAGGSALGATLRWVALARHLEQEVEVSADEVIALGGIGQTTWVARQACEEQFGAPAIERLLELGLLLGDGAAASPWRERDQTLRAQHWRPLSVALHVVSRWEQMQVESGMQFPSFEELVEAHGLPPEPCIERCLAERAVALPTPAPGALDATLFERYTGRNFDPQATLPLACAARLLQRTFGAQAQRQMAPQAMVLKKLSPSAGGLHPIEAYVLARRIDGVAPGLYHYHPVHHTLEPQGALDGAASDAFAQLAVADQAWFVDAPMMLVLAARVACNFWKYRNHAKAYRALLLDAGHLSQTFYLLATEAGMPAFVTAAINEVPIEQAFGLDPMCDAVIAVCGCGPAAATRTMVELRLND
jgi:putative peptide maturation dehydrogenase